MDYFDLLSDAEFEEQLEAVDVLLHRAEPFVLVIHTHHQRMMPLAQVRRQVSHMKAREVLARKHLRGIALVIPSSVIRGVLKVVLTLAPMPVPYGVFDGAAEALAWAEQRTRKSA